MNEEWSRLISLPPPETCGISGRVAEARAELQAHRGPRAARRPSASAPSARTWLPGCSPKGVDHVRASPHHVAHPAPLSLDHQQELIDASVREAEARSSRCWDHEPATCRVWDPSVACDQHLTLWRTQRRTSHEPTEAPPTRARRHQPPCRLGPTSAPSSYPFLRRSLGLGLGLACSFGDEQAPAAFVCTRPRSAAPAPAHVQLCVAGLDAPGARGA